MRHARTRTKAESSAMSSLVSSGYPEVGQNADGDVTSSQPLPLPLCFTLSRCSAASVAR